MEAELKVLSILGENNPTVTQRDLSAKTNISLGAINLLLKKMIDKGLIKIEKLNSRTVRYMLTPKGMMEKAMKTYDFVKRTYEDILLMKSELTLIVQDLPENSMLYLYGEDNEVCRMLTLLLNEIADSKVVIVKKVDIAEEIDRKSVVIIWDSVDADKLAGVNYINILDRIV